MPPGEHDPGCVVILKLDWSQETSGHTCNLSVQSPFHHPILPGWLRRPPRAKGTDSLDSQNKLVISWGKMEKEKGHITSWYGKPREVIRVEHSNLDPTALESPSQHPDTVVLSGLLRVFQILALVLFQLWVTVPFLSFFRFWPFSTSVRSEAQYQVARKSQSPAKTSMLAAMSLCCLGSSLAFFTGTAQRVQYMGNISSALEIGGGQMNAKLWQWWWWEWTAPILAVEPI